MEGCGSFGKEGGIDSAVEGGEAGLAGDGEGEQIEIGETFAGRKAGKRLEICQGYLVRPELVTGQSRQAAQEYSGLFGCAGAAGVKGISASSIASSTL